MQSLAELLLGNQFDHVYHEHRSFFSASSLVFACQEAGLSVIDLERTPMQGGSIRVTCKRAITPHTTGTRLPIRRAMKKTSGFTDAMITYDGLQVRAEYLRTRLLEMLHDEVDAGRRVAGFAASAKSTTLLNWCGIGQDAGYSNLLSHVVDTTPHKIGKFTPGTHIPIVGPDEQPDPDTYLMLAWNYVGRIRQDPFQGRWLVPIPQPVIL